MTSAGVRSRSPLPRLGEERAGAVQKILESWNDICCRGFSSEERTLYNSFLSRIIENVMQYKRGEEGDDG